MVEGTSGLLSSEEAATVLGVSNATVLRANRVGSLAATATSNDGEPLFSPDAVEVYRQRRTELFRGAVRTAHISPLTTGAHPEDEEPGVEPATEAAHAPEPATSETEPPEPSSGPAPAEGGPHPAPQPAPHWPEPAPGAWEPAPERAEPAAVAPQPAPEWGPPSPVAEDPTPVAREPTPVAQEPTPLEEERTPAAQEPAPVAAEEATAHLEEVSRQQFLGEWASTLEWLDQLARSLVRIEGDEPSSVGEEVQPESATATDERAFEGPAALAYLAVRPLVSFAILKEIGLALTGRSGIREARLDRLDGGAAWFVLRHGGDADLGQAVPAALEPLGFKVKRTGEDSFEVVQDSPTPE